jgi:hypothetical protein
LIYRGNIAQKASFKRLEGQFLGQKASSKETMPRANRHFLPAYLWHISNGVASSNRSSRQPPSGGSMVKGLKGSR